MSGTVLKIIAIVSMFIDHVGCVLFPDQLWLRVIGRLAFPIYCFLLVEGFRHTKNIHRYLLRMGLFALISEIPFDLALFWSWHQWNYQNVFFTLFLGLLAMYLCQILWQKLPGKLKYISPLIFIVMAVIAEILRTDYGSIGVLMIMVFYLSSKRQTMMFAMIAILCGCLGMIELFAIAALIPIHFYNGKRGALTSKFASICFYWFYPVHLMLLFVISKMMFI